MVGQILKIDNPNPLMVKQFRKDALYYRAVERVRERMTREDFDGAKRLNKLIWQWEQCVFNEQVYQAKKQLGI